MTTSRLSTVRTSVARTWMSSTVPSCAPLEITSPIWNGRVSSSSSPASRFWKMSLKAKPMATPLTPSAPISVPALNEGTAMVSATSRPSTKTAQRVSRPITSDTLAGRSVFSTMRSTTRPAAPATTRATSSTSKAMMRLGNSAAKARPIWFRVSKEALRSRFMR